MMPLFEREKDEDKHIRNIIDKKQRKLGKTPQKTIIVNSQGISIGW